MPNIGESLQTDMTLEQALMHLHRIKNAQESFYQDEAVKYAIAVLEALRG
jgi:hypothetical protein